MIAQARKQSQMRMQGRRQAGPAPAGAAQPGEQPGEQPGAQGDTAQGAKPMKPMSPTQKPALVGDKDTWGNLPAMLREEMENVFRTEPLPAKADLISRYYESVSKKSMNPEGD